MSKKIRRFSTIKRKKTITLFISRFLTKQKSALPISTLLVLRYSGLAIRALLRQSSASERSPAEYSFNALNTAGAPMDSHAPMRKKRTKPLSQ